MTATEAVADIHARIADIQARFGAAPLQTAASGGSASPFSQVLAAATLGTDNPVGTESLSPSVNTGTATGADVVNDASQYLGVPYVWGGTDPSTGLDCSGLVQRTYKDLGIDLPRVASDQARMGTPVATLADAKPGDLVAFGSPVHHIGIYAGDGKMVVAPHRGDVVKVQDITVTPSAIRRIIPDGGSGTGAAADFDPTQLSTLAAAAVNGASTYDPLFAAAGAKYGVDPKLLSAVARAESGYNPNAVSGAGAQGLMQLMPSTAQGLGVDPLNPAQAVDGAARLLAGNLQKFGSVDLAVAAYNAGGGAVSRYGGVPPFAETQNYVRRVLSYAGATS